MCVYVETSRVFYSMSVFNVPLLSSFKNLVMYFTVIPMHAYQKLSVLLLLTFFFFVYSKYFLCSFYIRTHCMCKEQIKYNQFKEKKNCKIR